MLGAPGNRIQVSEARHHSYSADGFLNVKKNEQARWDEIIPPSSTKGSGL
jgi:hypothetical protein